MIESLKEPYRVKLNFTFISGVKNNEKNENQLIHSKSGVASLDSDPISNLKTANDSWSSAAHPLNGTFSLSESLKAPFQAKLNFTFFSDVKNE